MSQMQGFFGGLNLGPIVTPFGNLVETFQTFFQQAFSSSTSSLSTMISPNFAPVI
ncbi:hypothetical protein PSHT_03256 [Puccinia striiformis]|uniref:Uncharacterized protein n=1 Tax=Puccinia striiformis TaxID=27350 RepID=A0A2S4WFT9_9BASI|nr:hypothetical protein PSHT_03256 [Puccinia striiformis]